VFFGLPSPVANGTNRVAILMQNIVSLIRFRQKGKLEARRSALAVASAMAGAIGGSLIAAELPEEVFDIALASVLLLVVATLFIRKPTSTSDKERAAPGWLQIPVFVGVGLYGGFVQAGVGFLLITGITWLLGLDLVKTNATKTFVIACYSVLALSIFTIYGQVFWIMGLIVGAGSMLGAWIGVHFAVKRGSKAVRWVIVAAAGASALRLIGVL
jgi:uncharacterized membrane protein YfcA